MPSDKPLHQPIVLLGAGLAGLSTAFHLEQSGYSEYYRLYEQADQSGGLCRSVRHGPFTLDYQGHVLHFSDPRIARLVKRLLRHNLQRHRRRAWVYAHGAYLAYPFQGHLSGLPPRVLAECLAGRSFAFGSAVLPDGQSFDEWASLTFGDGIARHFLLPYNNKLWRVPLRQLTARWVTPFVPVPSLDATIGGALEHSNRQYGYNATFWYPREGGIGALARAFERVIRPIKFHRCAVAIDWRRKRVVFQNGQQVEYDYLASSVPLVVLGQLLAPLPSSVNSWWRRLRYTSVVAVHVAVRSRQPIEHRHWVYFADPSISFFRVGFPGTLSDRSSPAGTSLLYVEVAVSPEHQLSLNTVADQVVIDLQRVGLIGDLQDVILQYPVAIPFAYIVYDREHHEATKGIHQFLREQGIWSIGRYGRWRYTTMEDAIRDGRDAAEDLARRVDHRQSELRDDKVPAAVAY